MGNKLRFAALLLFGTVMAGCGADPAKAPEYTGMIGKVYATKTPLLVNPVGLREISLSVPGEGAAPSLAEIPALMREGKILVLLPAGSRFQIMDVYTSWSTASGDAIRFTLRMQTPGEYRDFDLSYVGLLDYNRHPFSIRADLAEEVTGG